MIKKIITLGLATTLLVTVVSTALFSQKAYAATVSNDDIQSASNFHWVNRYTIIGTVGGADYTFFDKTADVDTFSTKFEIQNYECPGAVIVNMPNSITNPLAAAPKKLTLNMQFKDSSAAGIVPCQNAAGGNPIKDLGNPNGAFSYFFSMSANGGTIKSDDGDSNWNFTQSKYPNLFTRDKENGQNCQDIIEVHTADNQYALFELTADSGSGKQPPLDVKAPGCYLVKDNDRSSTLLSNDGKYFPLDVTAVGKDGSSGAVGVEAGSTIGSSTSLSLQCNAGFNPLNWLLCGAVKGMVNIVGRLDNIINSELSIGSTGNTDDPSQIFGSSTDSGQYNVSSASSGGSYSTQNSFYTAWKSIRNLALGLMVVAGLVIIIAQAFGTELVDAYTFRKMLPRLIISALAITLSWQLLQFFVKLTNDLGYGVRFLIYQPFSGLPNVINGGLGGNAATNFFAVGALASLGIFGLLSFAATAALAVFVAFLLLVIRQIVVIVLIIVAPIALVAYILPNTQNLYKLWWESLSKALLIFPIISAFIAAGRVFSLVAIQGTGGNPPTAINQFVGFAAYFAPYLLLPAAFKLAGGTLGRLSGMVNDKGKGGFDRLKNFRGNQSKKNMAKMKTGDRFQGNNMISRGFNAATSGAALGPANRFGVGARGRGARDIARRAAAKSAVQNNPQLQQLAFDDKALAVLALSEGSATGAQRVASTLQAANGWTDEQTKSAVGTAASIGFNDSNVAGALDLMGQNKARMLSGSLSGQAGMDLVRQSARKVSHGNKQLEDNLMGGFAYNARGAGRLDLGGESDGEALLQGWQRGTTQQHAQSYGASMKAFATDFVPTFTTSSDPNQRAAAAVALMEMQNMLPGATAENQTIINDALSLAGVDHNLVDKDNNPVSVEKQLADLSDGAISVNDVRGTARVYDAQTPVASRGGVPVPPGSGGKPPGT